MNTCDTCTNAIFDPILGEYKCKKKQRYVRDYIDSECEDHEKGKPAMSKVEYDLDDDEN